MVPQTIDTHRDLLLRDDHGGILPSYCNGRMAGARYGFERVFYNCIAFRVISWGLHSANTYLLGTSVPRGRRP